MGSTDTVRKLEAFLTLNALGIDNHYIQDNIRFYADRYHDQTGDWYRHQVSQKSQEMKGFK